MPVSFVHQPASEIRLGDFLRKNLSDTTWNEFRAAIAFVKKSGTKHIKDVLTEFSKRAKVKISVGIDSGGTSVDGLAMLLESIAEGSEIWVYHNANSSTFHPKIYLFKNETSAELIVGSGNLTEGGLYTNYEASLHIVLDFACADDIALLNDVETVLNSWSIEQEGLCYQLTKDLLAELPSRENIPTEAESRETEENRQQENGFQHKNPLFKRHSVQAAPLVQGDQNTEPAQASALPPSLPLPVPGLTPPAPVLATPIPTSTIKRFWIEARTLTGGSRNQLDLSRQSKYGRIPGSLSLFGLVGISTTTAIVIKIRYKSVDYDGNHIIFPQTSTGETNDTWRLQLNGRDSSNQKLTPFCQTDFVGKILIFKELGPNHYQVKAVNRTRQMDRLKKISTQWDCNRGTNGKHFGLL